MIKINYTPTLRDLISGTSLYLRVRTFRLPVRIFGFVLLIAWLASLAHIQISTASFMYFLTPIVAILMAFGHYIIALAGAISARKGLGEKVVEFQFTDQHYRIQYPGTEATVSWNNVMEVLDTKKGFLICPNKFAGIWIPHRAFQDSLDAFRNLLLASSVKIRKV